MKLVVVDVGNTSTAVGFWSGGRVTRVALAGKDLGVRAWAPFEWDVPAELVGQKAKLEIAVSTSVQPMYGDPSAGTWDMRFWFTVSGPDGPCGLLAADWLEYATTAL